MHVTVTVFWLFVIPSFWTVLLCALLITTLAKAHQTNDQRKHLAVIAWRLSSAQIDALVHTQQKTWIEHTVWLKNQDSSWVQWCLPFSSIKTSIQIGCIKLFPISKTKCWIGLRPTLQSNAVPSSCRDLVRLPFKINPFFILFLKILPKYHSNRTWLFWPINVSQIESHNIQSAHN